MAPSWLAFGLGLALAVATETKFPPIFYHAVRGVMDTDISSGISILWRTASEPDFKIPIYPKDFRYFWRTGSEPDFNMSIFQILFSILLGRAIGAGFQLALASDVIIAASNARFAIRETSLGLVPDLGGTGALVDAIGYRRTFALCATGDFLSADQAHQWGVVHQVADDSSAAVTALLDQLRGVDAGALGDLKALLRTVARDQQSWDAERDVQLRRLAALFGSAPT